MRPIDLQEYAQSGVGVGRWRPPRVCRRTAPRLPHRGGGAAHRPRTDPHRRPASTQVRRRRARGEVRYDEFTDDVTANRLVKAAAVRLGRMRLRSRRSRDGLRWIGARLENVSLVEANATALALPGGLLIYAQGEAEPAAYRVRHAGKRLEIAALDLSGTIDDLLARIGALAQRIRLMRMESA